jgi:predicted DNA-binding transcriptional regulator AlpA
VTRHIAPYTERGQNTVARTVLDSNGLKKKVPYCPDHVRRLYKAGKFPKPFKLPGSTKKLWFEDEIDAHLAELRAQQPQTAE